MGGRWTTTASAEEFLAAAQDFLAARRVEFNVPVSIVHSLLQRDLSAFGDDPPRLAWFSDEVTERSAADVPRSMSAVAVQTPPRQLVVSSLTREAAAALAAHRERPHRVLADATTAIRLADAWGSTSTSTSLCIACRAWSSPTPRRQFGSPWLGTSSWSEPGTRPSTPRRFTTARHRGELGFRRHCTRGGSCCVLEERPVALAMVTRPHLGLSRIGPVYTPPEHRRRGYAAAATAAAARSALQWGAEEVVLYTDLANPTSNALYARLGFEGVSAVVEADLLDPDREPADIVLHAGHGTCSS